MMPRGINSRREPPDGLAGAHIRIDELARRAREGAGVGDGDAADGAHAGG
jgi:hypothetical protein